MIELFFWVGADAKKWVEDILVKIPVGAWSLKIRLAPPISCIDEQSLDLHECRALVKLLGDEKENRPRIIFRGLDLSRNQVGNFLLRDLCQRAYCLGKACKLQDLVLSNCDLASVREDDGKCARISLHSVEELQSEKDCFPLYLVTSSPLSEGLSQ